MRLEQRPNDTRRHLSRSWREDRPTVLPHDRDQECLAAKVVVVTAIGAHREQNGPPCPVGQVHEVRVAGAYDRVETSEVAVREHRVGRVAHIRTRDQARSAEATRGRAREATHPRPIPGRFGARAGADISGAAVVVEEQRRVDPVGAVQPDWV